MTFNVSHLAQHLLAAGLKLHANDGRDLERRIAARLTTGDRQRSMGAGRERAGRDDDQAGMKIAMWSAANSGRRAC